MEARTAWFRETGEARLKEQLLIETMFCVCYLSKGSAVLAAHAPRLPFIFAYIFALPEVAAQPPLSVAMTKLTINRLAHALDDLASHMDVDQFALASLTEDHKEGVAAFLERRKPKFRGR
jgi:hypothetical protein